MIFTTVGGVIELKSLSLSAGHPVILPSFILSLLELNLYRLPFDSNSTLMKRAATKTFRQAETNHFLDKSSSSSSSSITEDDEVTSLNQNRLMQSDEHENSTFKSRHSNSKKDKGGSMIGELLQSNMDLKYVLRQRKTFQWRFYRKEIRDIRRQIKQNHGINQPKIDRTIPTKSKVNLMKNNPSHFNSTDLQ